MIELVVVTIGAVIHAKLQSNHHHQQTNTQAGCPYNYPTNSIRALKGNYSAFATHDRFVTPAEQFTAAPATRHELFAFQASTENISIPELVNHGAL